MGEGGFDWGIWSSGNGAGVWSVWWDLQEEAEMLLESEIEEEALSWSLRLFSWITGRSGGDCLGGLRQ